MNSQLTEGQTQPINCSLRQIGIFRNYFQYSFIQLSNVYFLTERRNKMKKINIITKQCVTNIKCIGFYLKFLRFDDQLLIVGNSEGILRQFDVKTFKCLHSKTIDKLLCIWEILKMNNYRFALYGSNRIIYVLNGLSFDILSFIKLNYPCLTSLIQLKDERILIVIKSDNCFHLHDYSLLNPTTSISSGESVITTVIQMNNIKVASGHKNGMIRIWDVNSFKCEDEIQVDNCAISALIQLRNLNLLSSGEKKIKIWDINHFNCLFLICVNDIDFIVNMSELIEENQLTLTHKKTLIRKRAGTSNNRLDYIIKIVIIG